MSTDELKRAAIETTDENGAPIVQIPLAVWQRFIASEPGAEEATSTPAGQVLSLMQEWEQRPEDDQSDEWWDEFEQFVKDNRMNFAERDINIETDDE